MRITPRGSIMTPLPESGANEPPPVDVQTTFTVAERAFSFMAIQSGILISVVFGITVVCGGSGFGTGETAGA